MITPQELRQLANINFGQKQNTLWPKKQLLDAADEIEQKSIYINYLKTAMGDAICDIEDKAYTPAISLLEEALKMPQSKVRETTKGTHPLRGIAIPNDAYVRPLTKPKWNEHHGCYTCLAQVNEALCVVEARRLPEKDTNSTNCSHLYPKSHDSATGRLKCSRCNYVFSDFECIPGDEL